MKNLLFVFGTRPEVIKLSPLILELKNRQEYNIIICNTEQQKELSNQTLNYFGLKADYNLNSMKDNQTLVEVQSRILLSLDEIYKNNDIAMTFVQGDTMTVLCGALASYYHKVPISHIEAGLRSYNLFEPFPEEGIRQMVSRLSSLHFCPTKKDYDALLAENIDKTSIYQVGNTVIDALKCLSRETLLGAERFFLDQDIVINDKTVLVTIHRRENHGKRIDVILNAITELTKKYSDHNFIIPVHPNPNVKEKIYSKFVNYKNVKLLSPLDYPNLVYLMSKCKLVMTDSGGIQEEAPSFGCPTLVLRYKTERTEGIKAGVSKLVGADKEKIVNEASLILDKDYLDTRLRVNNPFGDGNSAERIAKILGQFLGE